MPERPSPFTAALQRQRKTAPPAEVAGPPDYTSDFDALASKSAPRAEDSPFTSAISKGIGGATAPTVAQPKPVAPAIPEWMQYARAFGRGTRDLIEGVGDVAGVVMNPLNSAINMTGIPQAVTGKPLAMANDPSINIADALGLPKAETPWQRMLSAVNRGAAAGLATAGAGSALAGSTAAKTGAGMFGEFLAEAPVVNTIGGAGSGGAQEYAAQQGAPMWAQFLAALGGGLVAGGGAVGGRHLMERAHRGAVPVEPMLDATLDGGLAPTADIEGQLASVGRTVDSVASPDLAAIWAQRIAEARGRIPPNLGRDNMKPGEFKRLNPDQFTPVDRTAPSDVPVIAAPEGNVLANDAGGIAALNRKRTADSAFLDQAAKLAVDDPTLAEILNAPISTQAKIRTAYDRVLRDMREAQATVPAWMQPTEDAARSAAGGGSRDQRIIDITINSESGGNPNAVSPKGARGRMQVMDATNADPGFGVRPARDNSPAERERVGREFLDAMRQRYDDDMAKAWAAYNAGPGRVDAAIAKYGDRWLQALPDDTRAYVRKNLGALGEKLPQGPDYRVSTPNEISTLGPAEGGEGYFSAAEPRPRNPDDPRSPPVREDFKGFEDTTRPVSPTDAELDAGKANWRGTPLDRRMESGGSVRPFKAAADDPLDAPGFWEQRAFDQAEQARKAAEERLQAEWDRRAEARRQQEEARRARDENRDASQRYEQQRQSSSDPKGQYQGQYGQRPHKAGDFFNMTAEGYVADKAGKPVAFRNSKEAAKFAVKEQLGGDFDRVAWGANTERVVLQRREGSTYGQKKPEAADPASAPDAAAEGARTFKQTGFERAEPPAGRSGDTSQRMIEGETLPQSSAPPPSGRAPRAGDGNRAPYRAPAASAGTGGSVAPRETVVTPRGRQIDTQFEVVDAGDLITSDNPAFDQRFQPRQRSERAASDAQVAEIASRLDPEQLHSSRLASQGAPIVGRDGMVESGNGRTAAIRRAYERHPEQAAAYRRMIEERGFDTSAMERPVLVRRRLTELADDERAAFTREGQEDGTMRMSATEISRADAQTITPETMSLYRGGDVVSAGNRDFVRRWMSEVPSPADRNSLIGPDGALSAEGVRRIRSSLLAKAFDDAGLVAKIIEDPDSNIRGIGAALTEVAPAFASLRAEIAKGAIPQEFDIAPQIAELAKLISRARSEGRPIGDFLAQNDIFSGQTNPIVEALASVMFKGDKLARPRSANDITDGLRFYAAEAGKVDAGPGLFGDAPRVTPTEIAQAAAEKLKAREGRGETGDMFGQRAARPGSEGRSSEQELRGLRGEMERLARDASDPAQRELAARLAPIVGDDATVAYGRRFLNDARNLGEASPEDGVAFVRERGDVETTLHEAIHVAAMGRYGREFELLRPGDLAEAPVRDLLSVFNDARAAVRGPIHPDARYALNSPDEFLSMALTNKATQQFLERGSLWSRVVDGVRGLLGLEPRFKPLLDRALRAGRGVLDAAAGDPMRLRDAAGRAARPDNRNIFSRALDAIVDGDDLSKDMGALARLLGSPTKALADATRPMRDTFNAAIFANDSVLRMLATRFNSKALTEFADHFASRAGKGDGTARTYHEAVQHASVTRIARMQEALEPFLKDQPALDRIRTMLSYPNRRVSARKAEIEAAGKVRDLLKETIDYRKAAGEDIGEVSDGYFPRVIDPAKVVKDRAAFTRKATQLYRNIGLDDRDATASAEAWAERIFDQYAGLDGGLEHARGSGGIGGNTAKARQFGKEADEMLRGYYHDDLYQTLASYFMGAARRAEETRRFGMKGAVGSAEREAWVRDHGGKSQYEVLLDRIKADITESGKDANDALHRVSGAFQSNLGRLGAPSQSARTAISYLHAWNQIAKMDRTLVTSLSELSIGFIRGGPKYGVPYMVDSVREFAREVRGAAPSENRRWAEAISVGQDAMVNQALTARIGAEGASEGARKMLAGYYKGILLHQFTEGERTAATKMGRHYIQTLAQDALDGSNARVKARARRYLAELGIADPEAFSRRMRDGEPSLDDVRRDAPGVASDYATALMRFVNQTVIAPTRADKPKWASHPVGSLFYSLLGYSYAFKKNVMDRAGRMAVDAFKEKDAGLLIPAAMLPIMGAFTYAIDTYLRPALFGSRYDFASETPSETLMRVADRSGFTGQFSPILNAFRGIKYERGLTESLSGPALGTLADTATKLATPVFGRNSDNTNTAERNAAAAFYDATIEPSIDAFGAKYLRGAARSAVILGTGNRRGGALPGDKDAFVDAIAGPKEEDW